MVRATFPPAVIAVRPGAATLCWLACFVPADAGGADASLLRRETSHPALRLRRRWMDNDEPRTIAFQRSAVDDAIEEALSPWSAPALLRRPSPPRKRPTGGRIGARSTQARSGSGTLSDPMISPSGDYDAADRAKPARR